MRVLKNKNNITEDFDINKIIIAIDKSAQRINYVLTDIEKTKVIDFVTTNTKSKDIVSVNELHGWVELALDVVAPKVAKSYKDYRNYKISEAYGLIADLESKTKKVIEDRNRDNSNSNTNLISTKRTDISKEIAKELYQKMFLSVEEKQAIHDGFIYIHDLADLLLPQINCCLTDIGNILQKGFEVEGKMYTEPKDIKTAIGQMEDIIMMISAQHYGGHTVPEIDKILAPYYIMTVEKYMKSYLSLIVDTTNIVPDRKKLEQYARDAAYRDMEQAFQGCEMALNTVANARGSYPFTTFTFGDVSNSYEADVAECILKVRMKGHGPEGKKQNLIFPKLVFLHNPEIHDENGRFRYLFELAVKCSSKCMYPDFLSSKSHKKEGKWVSPMGQIAA